MTRSYVMVLFRRETLGTFDVGYFTLMSDDNELYPGAINGQDWYEEQGRSLGFDLD